MSSPVPLQPQKMVGPSRRLFVSGGLLALTGLGFVAFWIAGAWLANRAQSFRPPTTIPILSGSMAPTLLGPAWQTTCEDCNYPFCHDANESDAGSSPEYRICCPNCGHTQGEEAVGSSNRVEQLVSLSPVHRQEPIARGTVVAVIDEKAVNEKSADEEAAERCVVKRIAGLPGESIAIFRGDLFINGQMYQPPFSQLASHAIKVHDDRYREGTAAGKPVSRWKCAQEGGWQPIAGGFVYVPNQKQRVEDDDGKTTAENRPSEAAWEQEWLEYQHSPSLPRPFQRGTPGPIKDNYGYNQQLSRSLYDVPDVWCCFTCDLDACRVMSLRLRRGPREFQCKIDIAAQQAELSYKEATHLFPLSSIRRNDTKIAWGSWDGQVGLVIDDQPVFVQPIVPCRLDVAKAGEFVGHERPFGISVVPRSSQNARTNEPGEFRLCDLLVYRDIYYLQPNRRRIPSPNRSDKLENIWQSPDWAKDRYLLLGDNSPISIDARQGVPAGWMRRESLIGRVESATVGKVQ